MPCRDDGPIGPFTYDGFTGSALVVMLCKTLKLLRRKGLPTPDYLKSFERTHQKYDRERVRNKMSQRAREKAKKSALGKLSQAERRALGIYSS